MLVYFYGWFSRRGCPERARDTRRLGLLLWSADFFQVFERIVELLLRQTDREVGHIPFHVVLDGVPAIRQMVQKALQEQRECLVFDVATTENQAHIAEAVAAYSKVLWVGSDGLAEPLPGLFGWTASDESTADSGS